MNGYNTIHYTSDGMMMRYRRPDDTGTAVGLFMAIKSILVYKLIKPGDEFEFKNIANGLEIQKHMEPGWRSFAFYWLRQPPIDHALAKLIKANLVTKEMKNRPPYGYGCDELYSFTTKGMSLITSAEGDRGKLRCMVHDALYDDPWLSKSVDTAEDHA